MAHRFSVATAGYRFHAGLLVSGALAALPAAGYAQQVIANGTSQSASGTINTGTATAPAGYGLWALNSGIITGTGPLLITTGGGAAHAVRAESLGRITFGSGSAITTSGSSAYGLYSGSVGSSITATGASITTTGGSAHGVYATNGGRVTLDGGSVTPSGFQAVGLFAFGNNATITATNVTILTQQDQERGAEANVAGHISLTGGSVTTRGAQAQGVYTIDKDATLKASGTTIATSGTSAHGAEALVGAIELENAGITTTGQSAAGARVDNQSALSAAGGTIKTQGASAFGVLATLASSGVLTNVAISTEGGSAPGVAAQFGANVVINGGSVATSGPTATGLFAVGMVTTTTSVGAVPTSEVYDPSGLAGPAPVAGTIGAKITASGVTVTTLGAGSNAAVIRGGSAMTLIDSTIKSQGLDGHALYASAYDVNPSTATVSGSSLSASQGAAIRAYGTTFNVSLDNSTATGGAAVLSAAANAGAPATLNVIASNGSVLTGVAQTEAASISNLSLASGSVWNMTGDSNLSSLDLNSAQVRSVRPAAGVYKTLTVGRLSSSNGVIGLNSYLAGDGSPSDQVVVNGGAATGQTRLRIANAGGPGALTVANGIQVVQATNGGQAGAGAFGLDGRVVAGPYEYRLYRGGSQSAQSDNWYLRSEKNPDPPAPPDPDPDPGPGPGPDPDPGPGPGPAPEPLYRPEVAAYLANQRLTGQMFVHSLHDRLGEPQFIENGQVSQTQAMRSSVWLRTTGTWEASRSKDSNFDVDTDLFLLQGGGDIAQWRLASETDRLHLGVMLSYGSADSRTSADGNPYKARGRVEGYSTGLYATWFQNDETRLGAYVDTWAQYGWFKNRVEGDMLPRVNYDSQAWSVSAEAGYAIRLAENWVLEPQAQIIYGRTDIDSVTEENGALVSSANSTGTVSRLGLRTYHAFDLGNGRKAQPYATVNWWHTDTSSSVSFNQLPIGKLYPKDRYELKLGVNADFAKGWTGWVNVAGAWGDQDYHQYAGRIGVKYTW